MKGTASVWILKTTGGACKPFPIGTGEKPQLRLKVRDKHLGCGPLTRSLKDRLETLPTALQTQQEGERFSKAVLRVKTDYLSNPGWVGGKKKSSNTVWSLKPKSKVYKDSLSTSKLRQSPCPGSLDMASISDAQSSHRVWLSDQQL